MAGGWGRPVTCPDLGTQVLADLEARPFWQGLSLPAVIFQTQRQDFASVYMCVCVAEGFRGK